jgi:hypothetical protein
MPDTILTLTFTEAQVAELAPALLDAVAAMSRNDELLTKVQPLLDAEGVESMTELSVRKQAKLWIYAQLMWMRQRYDSEQAAKVAEEAAQENARDTSPIEVS